MQPYLRPRSARQHYLLGSQDFEYFHLDFVEKLILNIHVFLELTVESINMFRNMYPSFFSGNYCQTDPPQQQHNSARGTTFRPQFPLKTMMMWPDGSLLPLYI
jgi:hypothetical protein